MTDKLPPNLLALFAPRPPLRYLPHSDHEPAKRRTVPISGVAAFLEEFRKPDPNYVPTESWLQRRDRLQLEKKERQEKRIKAGLETCLSSHARSGFFFSLFLSSFPFLFFSYPYFLLFTLHSPSLFPIFHTPVSSFQFPVSSSQFPVPSSQFLFPSSIFIFIYSDFEANGHRQARKRCPSAWRPLPDAVRVTPELRRQGARSRARVWPLRSHRTGTSSHAHPTSPSSHRHTANVQGGQIRIVRDKSTNKHRGYAFIVYEREKDMKGMPPSLRPQRRLLTLTLPPNNSGL